MVQCMVAVTESSHLLESTSILYFSLSEEVSLLRNLSDKIYCNLFRIRFNTPYSPIQDLEIINTSSAHGEELHQAVHPVHVQMFRLPLCSFHTPSHDPWFHTLPGNIGNIDNIVNTVNTVNIVDTF